MVPKSIHLSNEFTVFSMVRNHVLVCWHAGRSFSGSAVRPIGPMVPKSIHLSNEFKVFSEGDCGIAIYLLNLMEY